MAKPTHTHCEACLGFGWDDTFNSCAACTGTGSVAVKVNTLPTHRTLVDRLMRHYVKADDNVKHAGRNWYLRARTVAEYLSERYGYSLEQCAYTIAVLSPNISWKQNVNAAENAMRHHTAGDPVHSWQVAGYGENVHKAHAILSGDLSALKGPKVTEFARGILGDPGACTVDVWMQRSVAMDEGRAPNKTEHRAIRRALDSAAVKCGETVRDFQAIVWTQVRGSAA